MAIRLYFDELLMTIILILTIFPTTRKNGFCALPFGEFSNLKISRNTIIIKTYIKSLYFRNLKTYRSQRYSLSERADRKDRSSDEATKLEITSRVLVLWHCFCKSHFSVWIFSIDGNETGLLLPVYWLMHNHKKNIKENSKYFYFH